MRHFDNFIEAYLKYADVTETPTQMHYWAAALAISAVLARKVWVDQKRFKWYPNLYVIFVGPPEVVRKSTTVSLAHRLLKTIPQFHFGSKTITWESLIKDFELSIQEVDLGNGESEEQAPLYVYASELGSFFDPANKRFNSQLIDMFDGEELDKSTKNNGSEYVERPLLILGGCTTPTWLRDNVPPTMVGDGLFSRIVFLYNESGGREIPWVDEMIDVEDVSYERKLAEDLQEIANLRGECIISPEARALGRDWYHTIKERCAAGETDILQRRQTQVVKLSTVLAASQNSIQYGKLYVTKSIFAESIQMLDQTNVQRQAIIDLLWKDKSASKIDRLLERIRVGEEVELRIMFQRVMAIIPIWDDFKKIIISAKEGGYIQTNTSEGSGQRLVTVRRVK